MSDTRNKGLSDEAIIAKWEQTNGNIREMARQLDVARGTIYYYVGKLGLRDVKPLAGGNIKATAAIRLPLPRSPTCREQASLG